MSALQVEMDFERAPVPPAASADEVAALVLFLTGRGWVMARDIIAERPPELHLPAGTEAAKRKLRAVAEAGGDRLLSFPGSPGYRVLQEASIEEINHGIRAHRSQASFHDRRVVALERFKYRRA